MNHSIEVGDVFVEVWGYDQLNVDCYQVVGVTDASVKIRKIAHRVAAHHTTFDMVKPVRDEFIAWYMATRFDVDEDDNLYTYEVPTARIGKVRKDGTVLKRVLRLGNGEPYLNMSSYSNAYLWDGERAYHETNPMFGH